MKNTQNPRRGRGRGGPGKRHQPSRNRNFESGGGETKVRGNAQQVLDKYQSMARDAAAAGEHIQAEGYWQHAEHYYRVLNADKENRAPNKGNENSHNKQNSQHANSGGDASTAPQPEKTQAREIPIEIVAESPVATKEDTGHQDQSQAKPEGPIRLAEKTPDQAGDQASDPVTPEAEAPKRRGRPRKVLAEKVSAESEDKSEATEKPEADTSVETVTA